jgi:hypothetical protein
MAEKMYRLRVAGTIPPELFPELSELSITAEPPETVLCGSVSDQSALFGLIARMHGLGLHLIEVRRLPGNDLPEVDE